MKAAEGTISDEQDKQSIQETREWWEDDLERANAEYQNDMNELEQWFHSGAIQIVDQMP